MTTDTKKLYKFAFLLAMVTIFYNLVEGLISTYFGYEDESLALFGFGVDYLPELHIMLLALQRLSLVLHSLNLMPLLNHRYLFC